MFGCGVTLYSIGIMQIILILFCAIPATKLFSKYGNVDKQGIYIKCSVTIIVWLVISAFTIGAVLYFGSAYVKTGFFIGIAFSFILSLGKWGMNEANLGDYFGAYGKYYSEDAIRNIKNGDELDKKEVNGDKKKSKPKSFYISIILAILCAFLIGFIAARVSDGGEINLDSLWSSVIPEDRGNSDWIYVASKESDKYHLKNCRWAENISEKNIIYFRSRQDAAEAGYSPCGTCIK